MECIMTASAKQSVITSVQDVISHFKFLHLSYLRNIASPKSQINGLSNKLYTEYRLQIWPAASSPVTDEPILGVHAGM